MATLNLLSFPDELILEVITKLNDWKIDDFDPVAVPDLQRVSSVCNRLRKITLPVLFKHMVVDTKFLEGNDLKRIPFHFVEQYPELAALVECVQLRVPPYHEVPGWYDPFPSFEEFQQILHCYEEYSRDASDENSMWEVIIRKPQIWFNHLQEDEGHAALERFYAAVLKAFPKLRHIEYTISTVQRNTLSTAREKLYRNFGFSRETLHPQPSFIEDDKSLRMTCNWVLQHLGIPSYIKRLNMSIYLTHSNARDFFKCLQHLVHLKLDWIHWSAACDVPTIPFKQQDPGPFVSSDTTYDEKLAKFGKGIRGLKNLRSLHLTNGTRTGNRAFDPVGSHCMGPCLDTFIAPRPKTMNHEAPNRRSADPTFPNLRSLTLVYWPIRESAFKRFLMDHGSTLQCLDLQRMILASSDKHLWEDNKTDAPLAAWRRVLSVCKGSMPSLREMYVERLRVYLGVRFAHPELLEQMPGTYNVPPRSDWILLDDETAGDARQVNWMLIRSLSTRGMKEVFGVTDSA